MDIEKVLDMVRRSWVFNQKRYPRIPLTHEANDEFILKHIYFDASEAMGRFARLLGDNDHSSRSLFLPGVEPETNAVGRRIARNLVLCGFRLAVELGVKPKEFEKELRAWATQEQGKN